MTNNDSTTYKAPPRVVCLCGSTRFGDLFREINLGETLAGRIVLSIGCDTKSDDGLEITSAQKEMLDELHLRKIDLADEVLIINKDGYIGDSTRRELLYALSLGKGVRFYSGVINPRENIDPDKSVLDPSPSWPGTEAAVDKLMAHVMGKDKSHV